MLDWDKLRIFHTAAESGSFTHAAEKLNMSQSAVSRQISALEEDLSLKLFIRHARGLVLTEVGEQLFRTAHRMHWELQQVETQMSESQDVPTGPLLVNTTVGIGSTWLSSRINEFLLLYPDIQIEIKLNDAELDLAMREADVAIRLHRPNQSEMMADAVRAKGLPVAYLAFEGEQHGFRRADTIVRCLEAELFFYGAVFGFTPADTIPPVTIDNL